MFTRKKKGEINMYYIEYEDRQSGKTYIKYFHNRPIVTNAYCPSCHNQVMEQTVTPHPITVDKIEYHCLHCGDTYEVHDYSFLEVNKNAFEPILYLDVYEVEEPKPRHVRYTPEFIEKATKAMRDTPLKRQNIHVHEDDMESTCPACGYMLYEEANMIFNYCPTCGQALNNNDFSEEDE